MTHPDSPQEREREANLSVFLTSLFRELRFSESHHLGLGDIRLTMGQQEEIVACAAAKDARIEELERAMKAADSLMRKAHEDHCACEQARAATQAELAAVREDAERYRWLRKGANDDIAVVRGLGAMDYGISAVVSTYSEEIDGDDLDAAIDAERAARKETE